MKLILVALSLTLLSGCAGTAMMGMAQHRGSSFEVSGPAPGMALWVPILAHAQDVKKKVMCANGATYERREARVEYRGPDPRYDTPQSPGYAQVYARGEFECQRR